MSVEVVTVATIVKNESDRWLRSAVECWQTFADKIVALDDGSTDGTPEMLERMGVDVFRDDFTLCGHSSEGRRRLWSLMEPDTEWMVVLDADMTPAGDIRPHLKGASASFHYFDLWNPWEYRDDPWWTAHHRPRPWAFHLPSIPKPWRWPEVKVHSEHFPENVLELPTTIMPVGMLHYGYSTPEARLRQYAKYKGVWEHLSPQQRFHVETIMHETPHLKRLPFEPDLCLTLP